MKENGERKVAMATGSLENIWRTTGCLAELSHYGVVEGAKHLFSVSVCFGEATPDTVGIPDCDSASSWATGRPSGKGCRCLNWKAWCRHNGTSMV